MSRAPETFAAAAEPRAEAVLARHPGVLEAEPRAEAWSANPRQDQPNL